MNFIKIFIILLLTNLLIIPIIRADPAVIIDSYELYPEVFMPGDTGTLKLTIKNAETTNTVQHSSTIGSDTTVRTDTVGATINRFVSTVDNLSVAMVNTQAAESILRDQDMAEGIAELTRQQLLQEGGLSAFKRFNEISRNHIMGILG